MGCGCVHNYVNCCLWNLNTEVILSSAVSIALFTPEYCRCWDQ